MALFYGLAAVLTLIAIAGPALTLLRRRDPAQSDDRVADAVSIHKLRLAELENECRFGTITEAEAETARHELERSLLDEVGNEKAAASSAGAQPVGRRDWAHLGAIAILIPAIAVPVYLYLGMPSLIPVLGVLEAEGSADGAAHGSSAASLDGLVAALARRLEQNPRDQEGLSLLGKSYLALERFAEAAATYEKLLALTGDRADVLLAYADALAMANQGKIAGRPEELVQRALKLEPESVTGLWLAGLAAFELGRYEDALGYWTTLQPKLEAGSPDVAEIERLIAEANAALGKPVAATAAETPAAAVAEGGATLTVSVELTPEMAAQTKPDQVVFIFARAVNGPPMPLAVAQRRVADLPVEVRLDDSMAMTPEARLSGFPEVDVGARVSISGDAVARSGDFEAESVRAQTTAKEPVRLRIASKRP